MTRIARHGGVRAFGKRASSGSRADAFEPDLAKGRAFGARAHFVVRTIAEEQAAEVADGISAGANIVAVVGVAAVLIASSPPDASAASAAQESPEPPIVETLSDASAIDVPAASAELAIAGRDLYLEVFINDVSTGLVGNFRETPDGGLLCAVDELSQVGIKPVASAIGPDGWVRVDRLPGVEYRLDEETQQIFVTTGIEGRSTNEINMAPGITEERIEPTASWGGVLNYSLFASSNSLTRDEGNLFQGVSGDFDARVFSPFGTLNQSFVAGYSDGELNDFVRLNTTWTYSDVNRMMTYRAGDFVSGGLSWTRPVYLGGFQAQRNFALRSDLVTMPLPSFKGTAAVPSTLEVYTQNAQTYSAPVGEGPFELNNLPIYSGGGEARVVLRDSLGRETETTLPFYASNKMLASGLLDFSMEAGAPRRNFGTDSFDYDERVYGVATARYGLSDWLTLEAHAEGGEDLLNGGVGAIFPLAHFGVGSIAVAGSRHDDEIAALINATAEIEYNDWTFFGRVQRTFGEYHDIASVTADAQTDFPDLAHAEIFSPQTPKAIEQLAVSVPMPLEMSSLNLSYTHIEDVGGQESQVVGVSYNQQVLKNVSLYASAFVDLEKEDTFGVFAGLSMPLGGDYSATAGVDATADGARVMASVAKAERLENGNFSWRAQTSEGKTPHRSASATYRSPWARFEAGVQQADKDFRATAQADGAIAVAGGGVFATNRIHDAFAVVDVGAADVDVLYQNRSYGKTNSNGKILVTGLNSYEKNTLAIDPKSLPVDAEIPATKEVVVPAGQSGVRVDFGVKTDTKAALVNLVDASGAALEVGLSGRIEGSDQEFVIGYDGQAYVGGLSGNNTLLVDLGDGRECRATFSYQSKKGEQALIEAVPCL
jgi:outer membrane usher protein